MGYTTERGRNMRKVRVKLLRKQFKKMKLHEAIFSDTTKNQWRAFKKKFLNS
jgi:hypothetical protein